MPVETKNFTMYDMKDPEDRKKWEQVFEKEKKKVLKKWEVKKKKKSTLPKKTKEEIATDIISKLPKEEEKVTPAKWPWRPTKISANTLQKLKVCFSVGMTDKQACYFCGIWESTLYDYQKENPEFSDEKDILKESISLQAKFNIWRTIKTEESKAYGWTGNSWKWLEKKDPDFKNSIRIESPGERSIEAQKLIDELALE